MDTERISIFNGKVNEANGIGAAPPTIDMTDFQKNVWNLPIAQSYYLAPGTSDYYEIEFQLANNFWGCNFGFGTSGCGIDIRQGIAHLIDRANFTQTDANVVGGGTPVDNPLPENTTFANGGTSISVTTPNPCSWDLLAPETGPSCHSGAPGGTAWHLANSTGVTFPWQQAPGSPDFCKAADHFVHAGLATGKNPTTCVLSGIAPVVTANTVNIFVRIDDPARLDLGTSLAQSICALFTGNFNANCAPYITTTPGNATSFVGFSTSTTGVNNNWWIYTAFFTDVFPLDRSLFFNYNSRFVSGIPAIRQPTGPCATASTPTLSAPDYMYLCSPSFDVASNQMEFATNSITAANNAANALSIFGNGTFTIPVFSDPAKYAYLAPPTSCFNNNCTPYPCSYQPPTCNGWSGVINSPVEGITNFFAWLNSYNPTPNVAGTIREGFWQTTRSLSPYVASRPHETYVLENLYDTPLKLNPESNGQLLDWMTTNHALLPNAQLGYPQCAPLPAAPVEPCYPASTTANLRLNLRNDIFFQDGRQLTGFDVKFAYVTLDANGAFYGSGLAPMTCGRDANGNILFNCTDGITVKSKNQVDIHLDTAGPFTLITVGTTFVFPGRYWSANCPPATWDADVIQGNVPDSCMTLNPAQAGIGYDPIANHVLVGSGPWECADVLGGTGAVGFGCSDTGTQNPPSGHTYTLTRYGKGQAPGSSAVGQYFRSSGSMALYLWAGAIGDTAQDTITASALASCNSPGQPPPALGATSGCGHWQQGIGQPGGLGLITQTQVNVFQRYDFLNWVAPQTWAAPPCGFAGNPALFLCTGPTVPPLSMATLAGVTLYEGPNALYSASTLRNGVPVGCSTAYNPTAPANTGGYDC